VSYCILGYLSQKIANCSAPILDAFLFGHPSKPLPMPSTWMDWKMGGWMGMGKCEKVGGGGWWVAEEMDGFGAP